DLPTIAETLPGFEAVGWQALVAPARTPGAIIRRLSEELRKVLDESEVQNQVAIRGGYVRPMAPAEVTDFVRAQQQMWNSGAAEPRPRPEVIALTLSQRPGKAELVAVGIGQMKEALAPFGVARRRLRTVARRADAGVQRVYVGIIEDDAA